MLIVRCSIDLSPEEGGGTAELMPGGKDIEVTSSNVYDYVRKYAKYRMVKAQEKAIQVLISYIHLLKCRAKTFFLEYPFGRI